MKRILPPPDAPTLPDHIPWPDETRTWWHQVVTDRRERTREDWDYALETALVHADVWGGNVSRTRELRSRVDRVNAAPRPARKWTRVDDTRLRELHGQGMALHSISREMDRAKSVISRQADLLGLSWDRSRTAAAARAVSVDNKARRVTIVNRIYDRIEHLQDRLEASTFHTIQRSTDGDSPTELDFVPTVDERNLADTISRYAQTATRFETIDSTAAAGVKSLIVGIAQQLGLDGQTTDPSVDEPTEP